MAFLAHSKGLKMKAFYSQHTRGLEEQVNKFLLQNKNITVISWITKMRLDSKDKPHFFLTLVFKEKVLNNAI